MGGGVQAAAAAPATIGSYTDISTSGSAQSMTLGANRKYKVELWGGDGGNTTGAASGSSYGGVGGYSYATFSTDDTGEVTVYFFIGGKGGDDAYTGASSARRATGGYNGGGNSYVGTNNRVSRPKGAGGGATHVSTYNATLANSADHKDQVILVAGGGGGSSSGESAVGARAGGTGGGASGQAGQGYGANGGGGTASAGGSDGQEVSSARTSSGFGQGTSATSSSSNHYVAGGGGGWYGGGGGGTWSGCGGGGSGRVGGSTEGKSTMNGVQVTVTGATYNGAAAPASGGYQNNPLYGTSRSSTARVAGYARVTLMEVHEHKVTYMKADCSTAGATASVTPGSSTNARSQGVDTPSGGYALYGWATSKATATRTYAPNASFTPTADMTLYPIYTRSVSYSANYTGGTNPTASTQYYYGGSAKAVTLAAGPSGRCLPGRGPGAFPQLAGPARAGRRGARRRSGRKARPGGPGSVPAGAQLGCSYARATPSGMWAAVVKWREPGGPWRQSSRTCGPERADAEAGLAAWRAELAGAGSCGPAPTVAELALAELASELASGRIERSTHDAQAGYARAHLSGTPLGDSPAGALTAAAALRWAESLAASLSPASARIAWGALRKAARRAAREGLLGGDPLAGLPAPRARRREPGSLDAPARAALAGAVAREWGAGSGRALAAALGLYAGLRAGECCALRWRDAAGGEVRVRAAAGRSQSGPYLKAPKSAASARSVPATAALAAALAERASALGGAPDPAGFCCSEDGALPDPKALSRDFSRLCAREGVRDSLGRPATFHSLRHTFATAAVAAGVDVKTLSAMLGHASAKLTLDVYAAADADARAAAAARMEGMYG